MSTIPLYLFDLDGTLSNLRHRRPLVELQDGSPVTSTHFKKGVFRGPNEKVPGDVWIEIPGTGLWSFHPNDVKFKKDWDAFHAACVDDTPIKPVIQVLHHLMQHAEVRIWSGRMSTVRLQTTQWLGKHAVAYLSDNPDDPRLKMRPAKDYTPDDQLKESWLRALSPEDRARLVMVFDDRQRVVDMWRRNGVVCAQVAPGDF